MILDMLKHNADDTFLRYAVALEYVKLDQKEKAIQYLKSLVKDFPDYLATYYQLGKLLEEKGKTDKAIEIYKQGREVAKTQKDSKTLGELGEALMILDVYDEEF